MNVSFKPRVQTDNLVTLKQAEELLGVSRMQLWKYRRNNNLPEVRVGKRTLLRREDIDALIFCRFLAAKGEKEKST